MAQPAHHSRPGGDTSSGSGAVSSLMAMAEYMLSQRPQRVTEAIQCLLATLSLSPPPRVEARVKLQLGLTLYHHSNNLLEAGKSLEQAMLSSKNVSGIEEVKFEAASMLARIHLEQGYGNHAKKVIRSVMDTSHRFPYWHCRLLLQRANIHVCERDIDSLITTLTQTADYAHQIQAPYTRILCLLAKGAHLLINKQYQEAASTLSHTCSLVDSYTGPKATLLRTFYMVIQVTHLLSAGLIKTAKPHLKQLQQCVKILSSENIKHTSETLDGESFEWLTKEQAYILVYLVCIMHSVLAGQTDKALSYANKAIDLVQRNHDGNPVMIVFQAHLLELIIVCLLMQGKTTLAVNTLQEVVGICHSHPQLVYSHRAVLHTLLGLYAFSTGCLDKSITQFLTALQHTNNSDLKMFININLAVSYMKQETTRDTEIQTIMDSFNTDCPSFSNCKNLKGALSFLKGLYAYNQVKLHEAKRHLRETLSLSNNNDLNKLTVCSLLLLGKIFLSLGNTKETQDMVGPAFQLSSKILDKRLQVWAAALSVELHHGTGSVEEERLAEETLNRLKTEIQNDSELASNSPYHRLIQWTVGDWPIIRHDQSAILDEDERQGEEEEIVMPPPGERGGKERTVGGANNQAEEEEKTPITDRTFSSLQDNRQASPGKPTQPSVGLHPNSYHLEKRGTHEDPLLVQIVRTSLPPEKRKRKTRALSPTPSPVAEDNRLNSARKRPRLRSIDKPPLLNSHESPTPSLSQTQTTPLTAVAVPSGIDHTPSPVPTSPYHSPHPSSKPSETLLRHTPSSTPLSTVGIACRSTDETQLPVDVQRVQNPTHTQPPIAPPPYHESLLHQQQIQPQSEQQQQQPSPTPSELYRQQQESLGQQLESLKQQQVHYHQYGASPQQWYHLQMQQQYLLQQRTIMDHQVQQLMVRERSQRMEEEMRQRLRLREEDEERKRQQQSMEEERQRREESERQRREIEEQRQRQIELERQQEEMEERKRRSRQQQIEEDNQRQQVLQEEKQLDLENQRKQTHHTHGNEQLWKPISQTIPLYPSPPTASFHPTPPPSQSPSASQTPPSRHLSPGGQSIHKQPSPQRHPMQSPPLASLMKGSPSLHNVDSSPEVHSGYSTPTSSDHRVGGGTTPSRLHLQPGQLFSAMEPIQSQQQQQLQAHMVLPQQMMLTQQHPQSGGSRLHPYQMITPPTYQMQAQQGMGVALSSYKEDGGGSGSVEAAILRHQQEQQQRMLQQQHQLRLSQDPGFLIQHGMLPHQQRQGRFMQHIENPLMSTRGHIGFVQEQQGVKVQQSPAQGLQHVSHPLGGQFPPTYPFGSGVKNSPYNHLRLQ